MIRRLTLAGLLLGLLLVAAPHAYAQVQGWTGKASQVTVFPTGTASIDGPTLQTAVNGTAPVFLASTNLAGVKTPWQVCQQINVPAGQTITGIPSGASGDPGSGTIGTGNFQTVLTCSTEQTSFTTGQAYLALKDQDFIYGIAVLGQGTASGGTSINVDCFALHNAIQVTIDHSAATQCSGWGYNAYSPGGTVGASVNYSQGLILAHSLEYNSALGGLDCDGDAVSGGGFCSDIVIGPDDDFALPPTSGTSALIYIGNGYLTGSIHDIRVEDGGKYGIYFASGAQSVTVSNVNCDKIECYGFNHNTSISVSGGRVTCCLYGSNPSIEFSGVNSNINISPIDMEGAANPIFKVDTSATVTGTIPPVGAAYNAFADANTETALCPLVRLSQGDVQARALVDGSSIAWDACPFGNGTAPVGVGPSAQLSLLGNSHTLAFPTNAIPGVGIAAAICNGTWLAGACTTTGGGNTGFATAAGFKFSGGSAPSWSTVAGHVDLLTCTPYSASAASCAAVINAQ